MTPEQAKTASNFHAYCILLEGPRGGLSWYVENWHRTGRTRTWKKDPARFRVPVKRGMFGYGDYVTEATCGDYHDEATCPVLAALRERGQSARYIGYPTSQHERQHAKILIELTGDAKP